MQHSLSTHFWTIAAALLLAAAMVLGGCSAASVETCSDSGDCFSNESCVGGLCQVLDEENQDEDCVANLGICGDRFCHPSLRRCVDCVRNDHCPTGLECQATENVCACPQGTHSCNGQCVASDDPAHCGSRCEPCPTEWGSEATCSAGECGLQCAPGFMPCSGPGCETRCIQCENHSHCTDPNRSRCYEGRCQGCAVNQDCTHNPDKPVCEQSTGTCIQCTVEDSGACAGNSCDPATNECTDTPVRSLSFCQRCRADAECQDTQRCVPMYFAGQQRPDGYCLYKESLTTCARPFPIHIERVSLSGYPRTRYCGIREEKLTCEAFHDFSNPCGHNNQCGAPNLDDGNCTWFSGGSNPQYRCTYACTDTEDCYPGAFCTHPNVGFCLDSSGSFDD